MKLSDLMRLPKHTQDAIRAQMQQQDAVQAAPKPSKYRAVAAVVDGIRFDSTKEARRYSELKLMHQAGEIQWFCRQGRFVIEGGEYVCDYIICDKGGKVWVEDVKGMRTPIYERSKKQMKARYGIDIRET